MTAILPTFTMSLAKAMAVQNSHEVLCLLDHQDPLAWDQARILTDEVSHALRETHCQIAAAVLADDPAAETRFEHGALPAELLLRGALSAMADLVADLDALWVACWDTEIVRNNDMSYQASIDTAESLIRRAARLGIRTEVAA